MLGAPTDAAAHVVTTDYRREVEAALVPGTAAVVCELAEDSPETVDRAMNGLRGVVFRESILEFEDRQDADHHAREDADLARMKAEYAQAGGAQRTRLGAQIDNLRARIGRRVQAQHARAASDQADREAKLAYIQAKAADAQGAAKARHDERIAQLRTDYALRARELGPVEPHQAG